MSFDQKPSPQAILERLLEGNKRFVEGKSHHPNADVSRRELASKSSQAEYAIATVLTCSDSRVPPEIIFDCGIMDIFVARLAGNVLSDCSLATIEYGILHVNTPLLLVMSHSQCGAITAVVEQILKPSAEENKENSPEPNIQKLLDILHPNVSQTYKLNSNLSKNEIVNISSKNYAVYVTQEILKRSPGISELHNKGTIKIVPAYYELETGLVHLI